MMIGDSTFNECLINTEFENLDILPSNVNLAGAEIELIGIEDRNTY